MLKQTFVRKFVSRKSDRSCINVNPYENMKSTPEAINDEHTQFQMVKRNLETLEILFIVSVSI